MVSYESIRLWAKHFGELYAKKLRRQHRGYGAAHQNLMKAKNYRKLRQDFFACWKLATAA